MATTAAARYLQVSIGEKGNVALQPIYMTQLTCDHLGSLPRYLMIEPSKVLGKTTAYKT